MWRGKRGRFDGPGVDVEHCAGALQMGDPAGFQPADLLREEGRSAGMFEREQDVVDDIPVDQRDERVKPVLRRHLGCVAGDAVGQGYD